MAGKLAAGKKATDKLATEVTENTEFFGLVFIRIMSRLKHIAASGRNQCRF